MSPSEANRIVKLKSSDGHFFDVEEKTAAAMSQTLRHNLENRESSLNGDGCLTITVHDVTGKTLGEIVEYCQFHADGGEARDDEKQKTWNQEFIGKFGIHELFDLINAASYLDIKDLMDLGYEAAAEWIKNKTVEEIREIFNIENGYTYT